MSAIYRISEHVALRIAMKKILELNQDDLQMFIREVTDIPFVIVNDEYADDDDDITETLLK